MDIKKNFSIGIWGFGIMGTSAVRYFYDLGHRIGIMDKRMPTQEERQFLQKKNIRWYDEQTESEQFFNFADYIFSSPGINISSLRYATHMQKWVHELDFFYQHFHKPIIAITGSIGKTSVTHILTQLFNELSIPVAVGGNIGIPTFDLIAQQNSVTCALLEVSSFQLMHCTQFAPTLAVWTNFYQNHLDFHATYEEYFLAKQVILNHQKNNALSLVPFALREKIPTVPDNHLRAYFSTTKPDDNTLVQLHDNECLYYIENNTVMSYGRKIKRNVMLLTQPLLNLSFVDNILLIASVCDLMKLDVSALEKIATTVHLPEHRIEHIATLHNIDFYNDSKATTTASTLAAVEKLKYRPLHLFLGGLSKGVDRAPFIAKLKNQVKHIYCFGQEADMLYAMCTDNNITATRFNTLTEAVIACTIAIVPRDCVLLSPAGSSYDLYENYEQRGNHFKQLITDYIKKANV